MTLGGLYQQTYQNCLAECLRTPDLPKNNVTQIQARSECEVYLLHLPGQHASNTCPLTSGDQKAHCGVRYGVPSSAHEQDDGSIEGVELEKERTEILVPNCQYSTMHFLFDSFLFYMYTTEIRMTECDEHAGKLSIACGYSAYPAITVSS